MTNLISGIALFALGSGLTVYGLLLIMTMLMVGSGGLSVSIVIGPVLVALGIAILFDVSQTIFKDRSST